MLIFALCDQLWLPPSVAKARESAGLAVETGLAVPTTGGSEAPSSRQSVLIRAPFRKQRCNGHIVQGVVK
jgi:hypothetical protein